MIEVQCTSCHTRYRIDEQVLPEGLPTFKCSRCGHVFSFEPRKSRLNAKSDRSLPKSEVPAESGIESSARLGPQPDWSKSPSSTVDRDAGNEPTASPQASPVIRGPSISEPLPGGAAASRADSEPLKNEHAAQRLQQTSSSRPDSDNASAETDAAQLTGAPRQAPPPEVAAEQARRFYSRLFTGDHHPQTEAGENLSFDFADEEPGLDQARSIRRGRRQAAAAPPADHETPRWQVGDDDSATTIASLSDRGAIRDENISRPARRSIRVGPTEPGFTDDDGLIDEEAAPVYNRARIHSSRFFMLLIFLIGIGFGAMTLLIHSAPRASSAVLTYLPLVGDRFAAPTTPAKLVALRQVNAAYQEGRAGPRTLVISGLAENVGTAPLRIVQLTAVLRDSERHSLASRAVYCGNNISPASVGQMTPHEIEFLQKLEPAKTFSLEPAASCRFVAVFLNPPSGAHAYDVSVSQAVSGAAAGSEEPGS
ncbi:MAG: zinc-ribbon domain-containing protein [Deltaproteobacteria bacterium]|nr:zinc-ribbon domain-containing protein [Deltaproteobacteria bacterium]